MKKACLIAFVVLIIAGCASTDKTAASIEQKAESSQPNKTMISWKIAEFAQIMGLKPEIVFNNMTNIHTLRGHVNNVHAVTCSPDGSLLASGSGDGTIKLWRVSDGQEIRTLKRHDDRVSSVTFSPDGSMLASGSQDGTVRLWRVSNGWEYPHSKGA